ncbi:hypothetical protein GALMADRAFT_51586 [Galerina marginata CBS 339.88]|uniref:Pyridoxamine 5'-phosphate oxidase Alr4036 family FMN-binding domain-containing protein n=1 Tax=Galerina marginata (strain CBS 339.88) TaxID=685588 RepID=A0A067U0A6_GALM3|nr:hypothetical protein GALMADRAFT_51586 [Galerina marginata CBS 339.88]
MSAPRWKTAIEKTISQFKNQIVIQIATIDTTRPELGPIPRVRSHIFRSFLDSPDVPALPLLISSTDIRTPKVGQLTTTPRAEVAWWIEGTRQQFRIIADVYLLPPTTHALYAEFAQRLAGAADGTAVALFKHENWELRRVNSFKSLSPTMKASWCRPTPGTRLEGGQEEAKKWPQRVDEPDVTSMPKEEYEEAKRIWDLALGNFVLVIIDPFEVDFVDLSTPPDRRSIFRKTKQNGKWSWEEDEVVP